MRNNCFSEWDGIGGCKQTHRSDRFTCFTSRHVRPRACDCDRTVNEHEVTIVMFGDGDSDGDHGCILCKYFTYACNIAWTAQQRSTAQHCGALALVGLFSKIPMTVALDCCEDGWSGRKDVTLESVIAGIHRRFIELFMVPI